MQGEEAVANEKAAAAKAIKDECEGELAVALPMLEAALAALNTLTKVRLTGRRALLGPYTCTGTATKLYVCPSSSD